MPYLRPNDETLIQNIQIAIQSQLGIPGQLLPESVLMNLAITIGGIAADHYGYLDWCFLQAIPVTATGEALEMWGNWRNVYRKQASNGFGQVVFTGTTSTEIPLGTALTRIDGQVYKTTGLSTIGTSTAVGVVSSATGSVVNSPSGTQLTLQSPIVGVDNTTTVTQSISGGSDVETDDEYRTRVLLVYQTPAQGGSANDYINWALKVPGVTRAWCISLINGPGTVGVYFMMDDTYPGGFPVGTNGGNPGDIRNPSSTWATGDQLTVSNFIEPLRPVTAQVFSLAPNPFTVNVTVQGLTLTATQQSSVNTGLSQLFFSDANPAGQTLYLTEITSAIAETIGTGKFNIISPTTNQTLTPGLIPVLGSVTYV